MIIQIHLFLFGVFFLWPKKRWNNTADCWWKKSCTTWDVYDLPASTGDRRISSINSMSMIDIPIGNVLWRKTDDIWRWCNSSNPPKTNRVLKDEPKNTPWKMNGWFTNSHQPWKVQGKWSGTIHLHDEMFQPLIFRGVSITEIWVSIHPKATPCKKSQAACLACGAAWGGGRWEPGQNTWKILRKMCGFVGGKLGDLIGFLVLVMVGFGVRIFLGGEPSLFLPWFFCRKMDPIWLAHIFSNFGCWKTTNESFEYPLENELGTQSHQWWVDRRRVYIWRYDSGKQVIHQRSCLNIYGFFWCQNGKRIASFGWVSSLRSNKMDLDNQVSFWEALDPWKLMAGTPKNEGLEVWKIIDVFQDVI